MSGRAAVRLAKKLGLSVTMYEQTANAPFDLGVGVATGPWDRELLNGIDLVVSSPGFSERSLPVVEVLESGLPLWSEIEFASRNISVPFAAVTGTNGKTSVTEAASSMLLASGMDAPATGNIGAPLSDFADEEHDCLVVEVSSFQLRFTETFHPVAAGITNVAVDHLDWHGSVHAYRSAKGRIFANQTATDLLVYDADDAHATELATSASARLHPISGKSLPSGGSGVEGGSLFIGEIEISLEDLASDDPTHIANLAMAGSLALSLGASADGVVTGATSYRPGDHRREIIAQNRGVTWIDDSKATNPHAALASIRALDRVVLIAGGLAKSTDVSVLASEPNVVRLIGIGESGPQLVEAAKDRGHLAGTLDSAVSFAAEIAAEGDTVLLAPGCASFDQFDSYEDRGRRFQELVHDLIGMGS